MLSVLAVAPCCVAMVFRSASCWSRSDSPSTRFSCRESWTTLKVLRAELETGPLKHLHHVLVSLRLHSGSEEEAQTLKRALTILKELISSVDKEVLELDRTRRLQEIQARLDPRAQAEVRGGGAFRAGELLRRKLLHEGALLWKVQGSRMKGTKDTAIAVGRANPPQPTSVCLSVDVQVLLMADILVFLQEKDQKFTFASLVSGLHRSIPHLFIPPSVHPASVHPFICLSLICSSLHLLIPLLFIPPFVHLLPDHASSVHPSIGSSLICSSVCLFVPHRFIHPSVHLSICLSCLPGQVSSGVS